MRSPRSFAAILAIALAATLSAVPMSADARVDSATQAASSTAGAAPAARADEESDVKITSKISRRKKPGEPFKLYLRGRVARSDGPVVIQRATACNATVTYCNFKYYRTVKLNSDNVFDGLISAPKTRRSWMWRARVGNVSGDDWWQTCTKRASQECQVPTPR